MSDQAVQAIVLAIAIATITTLSAMIFVPGVRDRIMSPKMDADTSVTELLLRSIGVGAFTAGLIFVAGVIFAQRPGGIWAAAIVGVLVTLGTFLQLRSRRN